MAFIKMKENNTLPQPHNYWSQSVLYVVGFLTFFKKDYFKEQLLGCFTSYFLLLHNLSVCAATLTIWDF